MDLSEISTGPISIQHIVEMLEQPVPDFFGFVGGLDLWVLVDVSLAEWRVTRQEPGTAEGQRGEARYQMAIEMLKAIHHTAC